MISLVPASILTDREKLLHKFSLATPWTACSSSNLSIILERTSVQRSLLTAKNSLDAEMLQSIMPEITESYFTTKDIPDFFFLLSGGFWTDSAHSSWSGVIRNLICWFIESWILVVDYDTSLLAFAVLFMFYLRNKRLLQTVLSLRA